MEDAIELVWITLYSLVEELMLHLYTQQVCIAKFVLIIPTSSLNNLFLLTVSFE